MFIIIIIIIIEIEDGNTYAKCIGQSGKCLFARKGDDGEKKDLNKEGS